MKKNEITLEVQRPADGEMTRECTSCKWAHKEQLADQNKKPIIGEYQYTCYRFPPSVFMVPGPEGTYRLASAFPVVTSGMVCSLHTFPGDSQPQDDGEALPGEFPITEN